MYRSTNKQKKAVLARVKITLIHFNNTKVKNSHVQLNQPNLTLNDGIDSSSNKKSFPIEVKIKHFKIKITYQSHHIKIYGLCPIKFCLKSINKKAA